MLRHGKRSNLNLQPPVICFLCVSKNECFHLGEINNEVEHSIFSVVNFFCNIKIRKPFEFRALVHPTSERHFHFPDSFHYFIKKRYEIYS